jgi:hypothetical protein
MRNIIIGIVLIVIIGFFSFVGGCQYNKKNNKPIIVTDTVTIYDTILHHIVDTFPYYIQGKDSLIYDTIPRVVDTAFILKNHFAIHKYEREWKDSLLQVTLTDYISENKPVHNNFNYKILRPQTIVNTTVDNSTTFNSYVYFGASLPLFPYKANNISNVSYISLNGLYAFPNGYIELTYQPYTKLVTVGYGVKILKFRK